MTKTAWRKEAQAGLDKVAQVHPKALSSGGTDQLSHYWNSLSDDTKSTLINSILGGVAGGGALGTMGALAAPKGQALHRGISSAMLGSILGAITGGAGTAAYRTVAGGRRLPDEIKGHRPIGDTVSDKIVGTMIHNPATTAGLGIGGYFGGSGLLSASKGLNAMHAARKKLPPGARLLPYSAVMEHMGGPTFSMAALPAGVGLGYMLDRYIKGNYE